MRILRLFEQFAGSILIIGMFSIATISVLSLNPTFSNAEEGTVAGIAASSSATTKPESIIGVITLFPESLSPESFNNSYSLNLESLETKQSIPAFKLNNFSNETGHVRVELQYEQSLEQTLRVELVDSIDRIILTSPILKSNQRTITVLPQSSREFNLEVSADEPINFPVELVLTIL